MPSVTFSATVKTGTSMKCWCTMPMPAAIASRGEPNFAGLPSIRISPSSGWVSPYRTFIERGLPRPVLAEQGVDLARGYRQADPVVRREQAEPLGDAPELKFHVFDRA